MAAAHVPKPFAALRYDGSPMAVVVAVLVFLFPAVYEAGWRPIARMFLIWIMVAILVVLVRMPLPSGLTWMPELLRLP